MSADKLPCLVITKVSPEIIEAWKNPKKLKWTSLNQFKRCAQYYVETTITNVLPSIKNKEHFTSLEQADSKSNDMFKNRPKTLFEEAQEFLGNVELTKRTRAQQKQIYKVESTPSTSSAINQVSSAANKKRIISLEHRGNRVGRNDRMNSLITPNKSKPNDKECNDLTVPSSINRDIVDKSVEPMQTLSDNSKSQAIQSTSKKCTTSVKVNLN